MTYEKKRYLYLPKAFCLVLLIINSAQVKSQTYTNLTENFESTSKQTYTPPTYQPLQVTGIDSISLNNLSEANRNQILQKIKKLKSEGKFSEIKLELVNQLQNHKTQLGSTNPINNPENLSDTTNQTETIDPEIVNQTELTITVPTLPTIEPIATVPTVKSIGSVVETKDLVVETKDLVVETKDPVVETKDPVVESLVKELDPKTQEIILNDEKLIQKLIESPELLKDPEFLKSIQTLLKLNDKFSVPAETSIC